MDMRASDEPDWVILIMQLKWSDFRKLRRNCVSRARVHILLFQPRKQRSSSSLCSPPDPATFSDSLLVLFQRGEFWSEQNQPVDISLRSFLWHLSSTPSPALFRTVPYIAGS